VYEQLGPEAYRYMNLQPEARLSRRREGKRASETAEERETWLFKRRGRFRTRRASQSAIQRERDLQQRREQVLRETVEEGDPPSANVRLASETQEEREFFNECSRGWRTRLLRTDAQLRTDNDSYGTFLNFSHGM